MFFHRPKKNTIYDFISILPITAIVFNIWDGNFERSDNYQYFSLISMLIILKLQRIENMIIKIEDIFSDKTQFSNFV